MCRVEVLGSHGDQPGVSGSLTKVEMILILLLISFSFLLFVPSFLPSCLPPFLPSCLPSFSLCLLFPPLSFSFLSHRVSRSQQKGLQMYKLLPEAAFCMAQTFHHQPNL